MRKEIRALKEKALDIRKDIIEMGYKGAGLGFVKRFV